MKKFFVSIMALILGTTGYAVVDQTIEERVKALEQGDETTPENTNPYEKWNAWDGISDKYQLGAVVEHNGILYQSVYNGQNVWEPGAIGTETLWTIYESEDAV